MTGYEQTFYSVVPSALKEIAAELKKLNQNLESLKGSAKDENEK